MNTQKKKKVFISHSSHDKTFVNRLIAKLKKAGVKEIWYDFFDIGPTTPDLNQQIKDGIKQSEFFLIILSPAIENSHWISYEIQEALAQKKQILALLVDLPEGFYSLQKNPHINDLLKGGRRKVIDFNKGFEKGFKDLLIALNVETGKIQQVTDKIQQLIDDDDPDNAERIMSFLGLEPKAYLPHLLSFLPKLKDNRKISYRISRSMFYIGEEAIEPLCKYLFLQARPLSESTSSPPDIPSVYDTETQNMLYVGDSAIDFIRHIILSGGNKAWFTQLGAESCLVGMAKADSSFHAIIVRRLRSFLKDAISCIVSMRDTHSFSDEFYDILRLTIETLGLIAGENSNDAFLINEFSKSKLWDFHALTAKDKLGSYIVECLSLIKSKKALEYLLDLSRDTEIKKLFFEQDRAPNPWMKCFVPFGSLAVDGLLKELPVASPPFLPFILNNLSLIPIPRAQNAIIEIIHNSRYSKEQMNTIGLLGNLARAGNASTCSKLLRLYADGELSHYVNSDYEKRSLERALAAAAIHASDKNLAEQICEELSERVDGWAQWFLVEAISKQHFFKMIDFLRSVFENGESGAIRGSAAIALSKLNLIDVEEIIQCMSCAEKEYEYPYLSIALSQLKDSRSIPGLVQGLRQSFMCYNQVAHDMYADALQNLSIPEAKEAYKKWYMRI